jgi:predicted ATPase/DNA-binding SARP family transcriptional activator
VVTINQSVHTPVSGRFHRAYGCPVELGVFGPVDARGPSGRIGLTRAKERVVLAALALYHGRVVSTDRLVDALWAERSPSHPEKALQIHVQRLRAALGAEVVETRSDGYALGPGVVVDAELFEAEVNGNVSAQGLRAALARWKGEPYVDLGEWGPAELERIRLSEVRDHALETCLALEIEAGVGATCIAELEAMVADKPLRERRWFLLMTALSRHGRIADALGAYQRARNVFAAELGIDPGPELQTLEEQILLADIRRTSSGDLPHQLTSFVGREREVAQLVVHLHEHSLITLTGVGGVGKTRLALQVAAEAVPAFPDGAWFCELAPLNDPGAVWNALAATLKVAPTPGRALDELVLEYLAPKHLLLVLDNCEHLLVSIAELVRVLVQRCARVAVLATSREGLALAGEHVVTVPSLGLPEPGATEEELGGAEAVRLFCDRAHDADRNFVLDEHNSGAVAVLCRRLDGIPLAIELAAARVRSLTPDELVARLDQRFKLLTRGSRASLERQQTLSTTIDWSYDLLTDDERTAFNRLSAFAGGFDLAAAEAVLGDGDRDAKDAGRLLGQLVDKSLLLVDNQTRTTRYRLLETIRQYAQERLERSGETPEVRGRHMEYYVETAETAGPHLRGRDQLSWAAVLAPDVDNLRAAFDSAVESSLPDPALRLVVALAVAGLPIGWTAMGWADSAAAIPGAHDDQLFPLVVALAAIDATMKGQLERATTLVETAETAQAALGTNHLEVRTAGAALAMSRGDFEDARNRAEVGLEQARTSGDTYLIVVALTILAGALTNEPARGLLVAEEAVRTARDAGIVSSLGLALTTQLMYVEGKDDPACELAIMNEIIDVASTLGDQQLMAMSSTFHEMPHARQGDWPPVLRAIADAAVQFTGGSYMTFAVSFFRDASIVFTALEHFEPGAVILGFADAHDPYSRAGPNVEYTGIIRTTDKALLDALGEDKLSELKMRGSAFDLPQAVAYLRTEADEVLAGSDRVPGQSSTHT